MPNVHVVLTSATLEGVSIREYSLRVVRQRLLPDLLSLVTAIVIGLLVMMWPILTKGEKRPHWKPFTFSLNALAQSAF